MMNRYIQAFSKRKRKFHATASSFERLNTCLGDTPDDNTLRKVTVTVNKTHTELRRLSKSNNENIRRVARIILHTNTSGYDAMLQKGLSDSSALIRCDTARFSDAGDDRTRFYNHLIKLIREDPDVRVRRAAGKRLSSSFADLYSVDFQGLPPLSRMLILDALVGTARSDEERAITMLYSPEREASFRAARRLLQWKTLERLFLTEVPGSGDVLERCAELGVADYLDSLTIQSAQRGKAVSLARKAGREDIVKRMGEEIRTETASDDIIDIAEVEKSFWEIHGQPLKNRGKLLDRLPLRDEVFRKAIEMIFPPPDSDTSSTLLFEIAKRGCWHSWSDRCVTALLSSDPDIRQSAASALSLINPREASLNLPPLLLDSVDRVRNTATQCLEILSE